VRPVYKQILHNCLLLCSCTWLADCRGAGGRLVYWLPPACRRVSDKLGEPTNLAHARQHTHMHIHAHINIGTHTRTHAHTHTHTQTHTQTHTHTHTHTHTRADNGIHKNTYISTNTNMHKQVLRARQLAAAFPDPIDPSLPPRPVPPTRPCRSLCGLRCARGKHACRHPCHVHAPFFHAFGDSDVTCTERDAWPLSEVGCVHDTTVPVPCHLLEQQASFWKGELGRPGGKRWPCSQLNVCVTCASPQSCRESCSLVGRSHVCKGRVLSLVAGGLRFVARSICERMPFVNYFFVLQVLDPAAVPTSHGCHRGRSDRYGGAGVRGEVAARL
jgi:hypothetical protein